MSKAPPADEMKRAAAEAAVAEVSNGMTVGLGTGSTAAYAIAALGRRKLDIATVATSRRTEELARAAGLHVIDFEAIDTIDIAIDGADELDEAMRAIKGGGGAMLREKIVATAARRMICIIDESKQVARLGAAALPVEVLPFAAAFVARQVHVLSAATAWRIRGAERFLTDQGNFVLDCSFGPMDEPAQIAGALAAIPGVLGHGLFLSEIDEAFVGLPDRVLHLPRPHN